MDKSSGEMSGSFNSLRKRAEAMLQLRPSEYPTLATEDVRALIQELSVHQIELELQNEELRQAQHELAQARDRYTDLYDFAPFGYVMLAKDGAILEANHKASTLLGVNRSQLPRSPFSKFLTQESADVLYLHLQDVFGGDDPQICEIELVKTGGSSRTLRLESISVGAEPGRLCRCALIDISDLKSAERLLKKNKEALHRFNDTLEQQIVEQTREVRLLAAAVSHLGEGVLITTDDLDWPDPTIVFVNEAMCRISGFHRDELLGRTPRMLQGEDTDHEAIARIKAELQAEHPCTAEIVNYRKDGSRYDTEWFITPLFDVEGRHTNFVSIHRDITARKRSEAELRQSHALLERRVRERTAELEEANRICHRANETKSRFLSAVSHDLRQPLQAAELYLSVLASQLERPEQRELYQKIRQPLLSMADMLNDLLDLSKFESGTLKPSQIDFPLHSVLSRIVANHLAQATEKSLRLECVETSPIVHSDPALLERVLDNFVANAVRYTDQGIVKIDCHRGAHSAWIAVSDTGKGIAEKDLETIFETYHQLDNPMRDRNKGFGLGLSIVKLIAELLDHRLKVDSTPGVGSTFAIEVPLARTTKPPAAVHPSTQATHEAAGGYVVLVVDDDSVLVDAITLILRSGGYQVHGASNGDEALQWIADGVRPDAMICDYRLPGRNGMDVIAEVRKALDDNLPALLFTGDTSTPEIKAQQNLNCKVLNKAVETEILLSAVRTLIGGK
ncbi:PAS domain S-box protein [Methylohalobius crimeensis]|uniref:PAS domain S-box protein n=1 Tax=Methylohalobius crimeensis TaxID=244365 RepID=UPI0003FB8174|nr:PAS domain S-box protein [Methylohalobius crimeensis]